jgi:hypothetical protein
MIVTCVRRAEDALKVPKIVTQSPTPCPSSPKDRVIFHDLTEQIAKSKAKFGICAQLSMEDVEGDRIRSRRRRSR